MNVFFKRILPAACIYFTIIAFIYAILVYIQFKATADGGLISSFRMLMFFGFSIILAAANRLLGVLTLALWKRILSHAALTGIGFYLFLLLPAQMEGSVALMGMFLFYFFYAVTAAIWLSVVRRKNKKKNNDKDYKSIINNR